MERFLASLSNELFKLRKRKKYLVFLIIGAVICVASALRVLIVKHHRRGVSGGHSGGLMSSNLPFILLIFLPLMAVMAASDLFFVGSRWTIPSDFPSCALWERESSSFPRRRRCWCFYCAFDLAVLYVVSTVAQVGLGGGTWRGSSPAWGPACWT